MLPLLLLLIVAIAQLGIVYNNYIDLTGAVRVGGRAAATQANQADACTTGKSAALDSWGGGTYSCVATTIPGATANDPAEEIMGTAPFSINLLGIVVYSGSLHASATERLS